MKFVLFRCENDKIHYLIGNIKGENITISDKEKIFLDLKENRGEKYSFLLEELSLINTKYSPDFFAYQSPQKYRGAIKDEEGFANSAIINLYCYQNKLDLLELTPVIVRDKLTIGSKDYKELFNNTTKEVVKEYNISKSDKLIDGLVLLFLLKNKIKFN